MRKRKYELISFEEDGNVLIVRFARHDNLNAINALLHTEMSWLFRDIAEHSACKSVVLTGRGRAFCAGGDIDWFAKKCQRGAQADRRSVDGSDDGLRHAMDSVRR